MTPQNKHSELGEFLKTRRERISPAQAGLPAYSLSGRRVKGLRREEVALLAGMSVDYYRRLERGQVGLVSEGVLEGLNRALQLSSAEQAHLRVLLQERPPQRQQVEQTPRISLALREMVEQMPMPVLVVNHRLDLIFANHTGKALFSPLYALPGTPNFARFAFLSAEAATFYENPVKAQEDTVAYLHMAAALNPGDGLLTRLVGDLSVRSETFARLWARHDVTMHARGDKVLHHPEVGRLELSFESLEVPGEQGLRMSVYAAPRGSESYRALQLLASWSLPQHEKLETR